MKYKNYLIEQDKTGYAPKNMQFHFWHKDGEKILGHGHSIENCKQQIDEYYE